MEHIPVLSTRKSKMLREQTFPLPLDQDAVVRSLTLIGNEYSKDMALKLALTLIECMAKEMYSPDALYLAMRRAISARPNGIWKGDWDTMILKVLNYLDKARQSNPISGLF